MIIILVLLFLLAVVFFPYIKRATERVIFFKRLKKQCALRKYKLNIQKPMSALFKNFSDKYDFVLDTGMVLYAVKMWDELYRHTSVVFHSDRSVTLRRKIPEPFGNENKRAHKTTERTLGKFAKLVPPSVESRKTISVFVVHPTDAKLLYSNGGEICEIHSRDRLYGMICASRREFLSVLKH